MCEDADIEFENVDAKRLSMRMLILSVRMMVLSVGMLNVRMLILND